MRAYVIKNEEGKYWQWLFNNEPDWEEKLYNGFMHYSQKDAEKSIEQWQLKDCEVVEITIAEGDLEKQLAEKEETIKEINKAYIETYKREREKGKEIANIRHQVCEKLSEMLSDRAELVDLGGEATYMFDLWNLEQCIKEIEGEE